MPMSRALCALLLALPFLVQLGCADVVGSELGLPDYAVVAHRGLSGHAPEESRVAYELARDLGVDYLEGDVQRTADGVLVLFHDDDLQRVTDVADVFPDRAGDGVTTFTLAELLQLDLGAAFNAAHEDRKNDAFVPTRILTLDELVDVAFAGVVHQPGLYLETKSPENSPGIEEEILALLAGRGFVPDADRDADEFHRNHDVQVARTSAKLIVQSFERASLEHFRALAPQVPRTFLFDSQTSVGDAVEIASDVDVDAHLGPIGYSSFAWDISAIHGAGKVAHPWVINEGWQLDLVNSFGVDGVFSDFAERALAKQGRASEDDVLPLLQALSLQE